MFVSTIGGMATMQILEDSTRISGESRGKKSIAVKQSVIPDDGPDEFSVSEFMKFVDGASKQEAEAAFAALTPEQQEAVFGEVNDIDTLLYLMPPIFQELIERAMLSLFQMQIMQELMKDF